MFSFFNKKYDVYTDGSQKGQWGSWAFVIVFKNKIIHESSGKVHKGDSLQMEFRAVIEALSYLKLGSKARIFSDSKILIDSIANSKKKPHRNIEQSQKITELIKAHTISWQWVRAHAGNVYNERCDQLCTRARDLSKSSTE